MLQLPPYQKHFNNQVEVVVQQDIGLLEDEMRIKVKIQPFKLLMNQSVLVFLLDFFDVDLGS
jgi:hypothetical protein